MKSSNQIFSFAMAASLGLMALSGCGDAPRPPADTPMVQAVKQNIIASDKCSATSTTCNGTAIEVSVTFDKSRILNREFMYGVDLQYSSQFDDGMNLYNQSLVTAQTPVGFRIMGNQLELVTDNKIKFPSDNNHPEDLIGRFDIIAQDDKSITVSGLNTAPFLAYQLGPIDKGSVAVSFLDHWIRSFEFDSNDNYLLQQTSLKLSDGKTIVEFMESVYPRERLKAGADFKKFEMDPNDPVGASDGDVARFRFLPGDTIVTHDKHGEKKLAYATHFDISNGATIDWYVTPNIPDEYLEPVKDAVEGWNRYFLKMKGIERPVMRFLGRLPQGKYIGDPRYNVINWDSRLIAGAAYESQSADPESGKQSHSLIYMPAAWLKIGSDYWRKGLSSDENATDPADGSFVSGPRPRLSARVSCARELRDGVKLALSGRIMGDELNTFGVRLLKQTLFHEVGHALGFAHNFEGSLSYDPSDKNSMFSTSIMDYNDYELERAAFYNVKGFDGPLLEYDRQTLSAIYNDGKDVPAVDEKHPALPACNDAEADNLAGGVNPLCMRYDVQKDPSQSIVTAAGRIELGTLDARDITLAEAMNRVPDLALPDDSVRGVKEKDDFDSLTAALVADIRGPLDFYIVSDVAALDRTVRTNIKTLYEIDSSTLLDGYDADAMRERVFAGVQKVMGMTDLPQVPKEAVAKAIQELVARASKAPYFASLSNDARKTEMEKLTKTLTGAVNRFVKLNMAAGRARVLASLARQSEVDFFLGKEADKGVDYEKNIVSLLADTVTAKSRSSLERMAAASALASFKGRQPGDDAVAAITASLLEERATPATNDERQTIETIVKLLALKK